MTIPGFYIDAYLPEEFDLPKEQPNLHMRIEHRERQTASLLNIREIALYQSIELQNGQQWFGNFAFRTTFDLVALNGGVNIPPGTTTLTLSATTSPPLIAFQNTIVPLPSFVSATTTATTFFFNGPGLSVTFDNSNASAQKVSIINGTGLALTQCYWVFNYYKT